MNTSPPLRHRTYAIVILALPLALLHYGEGRANSEEAGVTLEIASVDFMFDMDFAADNAVALFFAVSLTIDAVDDPDCPFSASTLEEFAATNMRETRIIVADDRSYRSDVRIHFLPLGSSVSRYLEIARNTDLAVSDEGDVTPADGTMFDYSLATISGNVVLDTDESDTNAEIDYVQFYAEPLADDPDEPFLAADRPADGTTSYMLHVPAVDGAIRVRGYAHVTIPYDDDGDGNDEYASLIYAMEPAFLSVSQGGNLVENDGQTALPDWVVTARRDVVERGAAISGNISSLGPDGYVSQFHQSTSLDEFLRQRVRGRIPGASNTSFTSDWVTSENGAYSDDNIVFGEHQVYTERTWDRPPRLLRTPNQPLTLNADTNPTSFNFDDEVVEIAGDILLTGFYGDPNNDPVLEPNVDFGETFTFFRIEATSDNSGLSRSQLQATGSSFALPVVEGTWTIDDIEIRRVVDGEMNVRYNRRIDTHVAVVDDAVGQAGPQTADIPVDLYPVDLVFSVLGADVELSGGLVRGTSAIFDGCELSFGPRSIYAIANQSSSAVRTVRLMAEPGCYTFDASMAAFDTTLPDEPSTTVAWDDIPFRLDGQDCSGNCSLLDATVSIELPGQVSQPISITEVPIGPQVNFGIGTDPDGQIVHYNITSPNPNFSDPVEICISFDPAAIAGEEPDEIFLLHYLSGSDSQASCLEGQPQPNIYDPPNWLQDGAQGGWCATTAPTNQLHDPSGGVVCGWTFSFSPFAIAVVPDADDDGSPDALDNCPNVANASQVDSDGDGSGDGCDPDDDDDGIDDGIDNCPVVNNPAQADNDGDGSGDQCDDDDDDDGSRDDEDNCPVDANPLQRDTDGDGIGDACEDDSDGDGVPDDEDNCPIDADPTQKDTDGDGQGNVCDEDDDGDGVLDGEDNCPSVSNPAQNDFDGDGIGDACAA